MYTEIKYQLSKLQPLEDGAYEGLYEDEEIVMLEDGFKFLDLPLSYLFNVDLYYELQSPEVDTAICRYIKHLFNTGPEANDVTLVPISYLLTYEKYKDMNMETKMKFYYFFNGMIDVIYKMSQEWKLEVINVKIGKKISFVLGELTWM